jgi:beta-galactosidase
MEQNRREFLQTVLSAPLVSPLSGGAYRSPLEPVSKPSQFLFGASTYPELQVREEWHSMLDEFQRAHMNVVRVAETSWGNLEVAPGEFNFGWLRDYLDDLAERKMKAILGTSTYTPPLWLTGEHPEILVQLQPGWKGHPMSRKAACLSHSLYREVCRRYISAIGREFKNHPAVIGWQLDNEIESMVAKICHNPACESAWQEWLKKTYNTPEELNQRLELVSWGMKVRAFREVPQPTETIEDVEELPEMPWSVPGRRHLPALSLAHYHFRRDLILNFFAEQTSTLREAGVKQQITTDWNTTWTALADDPLARKSLDIASLNFYQTTRENPEFWTELAWHQDMHRSAHGRGHYLVTETRFGVTGQTFMDEPFPNHDQFRMWGVQAAAFGASSLIYWSGNRWRGGHWPHWGGLLDWSGRPEPDFGWAVDMGEFFQKWGSRLLENPVNASALVLTDFDQRTALQIYPHTPSSLSLLPVCFDALHRLGAGVDSMDLARAADPANLEKYSVVVIPAATALDGTEVPQALDRFAHFGGAVLITPCNAYQSWDGIFRGDGFGANLRRLTGTLVRTARRMGTAADAGRKDQMVTWEGAGLSQISPVGMDGYCEYIEVDPDTQVVARFSSEEAILDGRPAATLRNVGKGTVIKLGFWPKDDSVLQLLARFLPENSFLGSPLPPGGQAVPRTDNSLLVVNTSGKPLSVSLRREVADRLQGKSHSGELPLAAYGVLWLE